MIKLTVKVVEQKINKEKKISNKINDFQILWEIIERNNKNKFIKFNGKI